MATTAYSRRHLAGMTNRILRVYRAATVEQMAEGVEWYSDARRFCADASDASGLSVQAVAGIVAALSPMTAWDVNKARALAIVAGANNVGLNTTKAVRIRDGEHPLSVLGGNKVRNFYRAIEDPGGDAVVIDRHAFDIAVGKVNGDDDRKTLERVGQYELFADAYRAAAYKVGVSPMVMQAVVWVVHRETAVKHAAANRRKALDRAGNKD